MSDPRAEILFHLLDGSRHATADMPYGKPGPILLPEDRTALIAAHLDGGPFDVMFAPAGKEPSLVHVDRLGMSNYTPDGDGMVHAIAADLDAADGHANGLVDPFHAARCISERVANAGLSDGLLITRSNGGHGLHVRLFPPAPITLADGVLAIAALAQQSLRVASGDVADAGIEHAFRCANGSIARPGQSGAFELFPYSTQRPAIGWPLALPFSGAAAARGGGRVIEPDPLTAVPRCNAASWSRFISEARAELARRSRPAPARPRYQRNASPTIDPRAAAFLDGRTVEGERNRAAFTSACHLIGCGLDSSEVESRILAGAEACGLPEREARTAIFSAFKTMRAR